MCTVSTDQHYQPCLPFRHSVLPIAVILSDMSRNGCDWMHPSTHPQSSLVQATTNCIFVSRPVHHSNSLHIILSYVYSIIWYQSCAGGRGVHATGLRLHMIQCWKSLFYSMVATVMRTNSPFMQSKNAQYEAARCSSSCEHLWHVVLRLTPCRAACANTEAGCI